MRCTHCFTRNSPIWSRDTEGQPLCNLCGLYVNLLGIDGPLSLPSSNLIKERDRNDSSPDKLSSAANNRLPTSCTNCSTQTTPLWRRNLENQPLCNACGLFFKLHGVDRPLSTINNIIKKRGKKNSSQLSVNPTSPFTKKSRKITLHQNHKAVFPSTQLSSLQDNDSLPSHRDSVRRGSTTANAPVSDKTSMLCNRLHVCSIPQDTSEEELKAIFSRQPGYKRLFYRRKQPAPPCIVEFADASSAMEALNELDGRQLRHDFKNGIRLGFSEFPLASLPSHRGIWPLLNRSSQTH